MIENCKFPEIVVRHVIQYELPKPSLDFKIGPVETEPYIPQEVVMPAFVLLATQKSKFSVKGQYTVNGQTFDAALEGIVGVVSDPTILELTQDATDPSKFAFRALGPVGTCQIQLTADARIGEGVNNISGVLDVEVRAPEAQVIVITPDTPEDQ